MGFVKEFREFAMKGNIVDLAVAVVIGGAFAKIVDALTNSIITPVIAAIIGKGSMSELSFTVGSAVFPIGLLVQAVIDFILVALVLFLIIRTMNRLKKETPPPPAEPSSTDKLLMEIRDALKK